MCCTCNGRKMQQNKREKVETLVVREVPSDEVISEQDL